MGHPREGGRVAGGGEGVEGDSVTALTGDEEVSEGDAHGKEIQRRFAKL